MRLRSWVLLSFLLLDSIAFTSSAYASSGQGDRVLFGSSEVVDEGEETGDLVVFGGDLDIRGRVLGDVVSFGGRVTLSGEIVGDLVSMGGSVDLKSTSAISGNLVAFGTVSKEQGAKIGGRIREVGPQGEADPSSTLPPTAVTQFYNPVLDFFGSIMRGIVVSITLLAISLLVVLFFPAQVELIKETISLAPLWSAAVGFLTIAVAIFLTPVLVLSVLGIPLVPILWLVLTIGIFFGFVSLGQLIGERLFEAMRIRRGVPLFVILSGVLLLTVVVAIFSAAFSSCLGIVAITLVSMPGLGAVVLTRFGTMMPRLPR